jgi:toxin ParE1/3/4
VSRYVLSAAARVDLEQIWDYTCERWDGSQAEKYLREIQRAIDRIADNPMIGRVCDEVRPGYRKHAVLPDLPWLMISGGNRNPLYDEPAAVTIVDPAPPHLPGSPT